MGWGDGPDVFRTGEDPDDPNSSPTRQEPLFSTDASDDYEVLKRVRETWTGDTWDRFIASVEKITALRALKFDEENQTAMVFMCGQLDGFLMFYQPGDYSHAAYLALTGATQCKTNC